MNSRLSFGWYTFLMFLPIIFILNLITGSILYFLNKPFIFPFINAFIFPCVFFIILYMMSPYSESEFEKNNEDWIFYINGKQFDIGYSSNNVMDIALDSTYSITVKMNSHTEKSYKNGLGRGDVHVKNDTIYFCAVDSSLYYIYGDTLYNFENIGKIKVEKK
ncbi:MAG: hypothetical protein LBQ28_01115, partial [Prevotellaceae bacterium]|nr:hypothetical protein [Prevotellaceae bacterium]